MRYLLLLFLMNVAALSAEFSFSAGVDLLIWKPVNSDSDFVNAININPAPPNVHYRNFHYDFEPGYRIFVGMQPLCSRWKFVASYEQVDASNQQTFTGGGGTTATSPLTFDPLSILYRSASGTSQCNYRAAEVAAYYGCYMCEGHLFRPFTALQYLQLERKVHFSGITNDLGTTISTAFSANYQAAGLSIGAEYSYQWLCGLGFYAKGSAALNVGQLRTKINRITNDPDVLSTHIRSRASPIIPELRLAIGLTRRFCLLGHELAAKLGYEFIDFINTPQAPYSSTGGVHESFTGGNCGFHGFTFALEGTF